ncbi:hypothetical protein ABEB36_014803 [Hypothenemus hampei]|uniref:Uncharacterized protein n=1 Tax=Hypothenemus hampei TaxID=57062 RepID=A0ABD1E1T1_HYPHA
MTELAVRTRLTPRGDVAVHAGPYIALADQAVGYLGARMRRGVKQPNNPFAQGPGNVWTDGIIRYITYDRYPVRAPEDTLQFQGMGPIYSTGRHLFVRRLVFG